LRIRNWGRFAKSLYKESPGSAKNSAMDGDAGSGEVLVAVAENLLYIAFVSFPGDMNG
jgi:hypothetical protein